MILFGGGLTACSSGGSGHSAASPARGRTLTAITIDPIDPSIAPNTTVQLHATGHFSDATTEDLTNQVTWASADTTIADVSNSAGMQGLVTGVSHGVTTVTAVLGSVQGSTTLTVTAATLTSITIDPALPSIANGTTIQLAAFGNFSDGTVQDLTQSVTWASTDPTIAQVSDSSGSKGLVTGVAVGSTTITATELGVTGSTTIIVTAATLTSITIDPTSPSIAKGTSIQLAAYGNFSDGTTQDLTDSVTWTSSAGTIAHVSDAAGTKGLVNGLAVGTATITAAQGGVQGSTDVHVTSPTLTKITLDPSAPSIAKGTHVQLTATGEFTDGTTEDLTSQVSWTSADDTVAEVSNLPEAKGLVTGIDVGSALITATLNGIEGSTTVTVTAATLTSITVTPVDPTIAKGTEVHLTAIAHFSDSTTEDLTSQVSWTSADDTVAEVGNVSGAKGLVTGVDVGSALITATLNGIEGSTTVTVTAATLTSIIVTPAFPSMVVGQTLQLTATAHFSDGSTQDLTQQVDWISSNPRVAHVISSSSHTNGRLLARRPGTATITATLDGLEGSTVVTVTP